jgi:hypothetical protein
MQIILRKIRVKMKWFFVIACDKKILLPVLVHEGRSPVGGA